MKERSTEGWEFEWGGRWMWDGGQKSSQHLFSQGFVRASLNMDGVWSRAGASGTPQTAQAAQAGPSCCGGGLLSYSPRLSLRLPPLLPQLASLFTHSLFFSLLFLISDLSLCRHVYLSINRSDDKVHLFFTVWPVCSCLFHPLIFSLLPLFILFLLCASCCHPCSIPSLRFCTLPFLSLPLMITVLFD